MTAGDPCRMKIAAHPVPLCDLLTVVSDTEAAFVLMNKERKLVHGKFTSSVVFSGLFPHSRRRGLS